MIYTLEKEQCLWLMWDSSPVVCRVIKGIAYSNCKIITDDISVNRDIIIKTASRCILFTTSCTVCFINIADHYDIPEPAELGPVVLVSGPQSDDIACSLWNKLPDNDRVFVDLNYRSSTFTPFSCVGIHQNNHTHFFLHTSTV